MSETPQTPPPAEPPPSSGAGSSFSADQMKSSVQEAHQFDLGIIVVGVLTFIFSLIPSYYTAHISFSGVGASYHDNFNAWHGFWGWFAALLALAAAIVVAAQIFGGWRPPPFMPMVVLGLFGLALLCTLIAGLTWAGVDTAGVDIGKYTGHGFSYWVSLLLIIAGTALAFLRYRPITARK